ncbi:DUF4058 family protein [Scytonema sp. NUACC26]|uniref:DUF4058 family protein n=1 Tax=Scytonema sp. NUACC26 TaxID=3140176 RepID=UPI0034DBBE6F
MAMKGYGLITDYRIVVSQCDRRPKADLYAFTMREPIPEFLLPLKEPLEVITVNLQSIVSGVYSRGGYAIRIDYRHMSTRKQMSVTVEQWVLDAIDRVKHHEQPYGAWVREFLEAWAESQVT